ncbi:MAG: deoxyribodipyrimidine photolyase [Burkholderiales bacterium PBB4]|nr:MAG: deoxyribodipyrimidine photolyase [Burkholderiales bacterium PBB4]
MRKQFKKGLVWFRRDLRVHDNPALKAALAQCEQVWCVFVFDTAILNLLPRVDRRVEFIHGSVQALDEALRVRSGGDSAAGLIVLHANAEVAIPQLAVSLGVTQVFAARDYEPAARTRDEAVRATLHAHDIELTLLKDHVVFEEREVLTQSARPYGVFTPYKRAWLAKLALLPVLEEAPTHGEGTLIARPAQYDKPLPLLNDLGFEETNLKQLSIQPGEQGAAALMSDFLPRMQRYAEARNFPSVKGPSYLSVHLRFGTVSIRQLVAEAYALQLQGSEGAATWLSELIWRDFYFQILANFPEVAVRSFKPEYDEIQWASGPAADQLFEAWCIGKTGYPIVDAAMLQLNQTGYMHNRLRMVAGSFLVKHLGIDWRRGERYFAEKLNDFDLSANNGGWQWVSSSGCDAQPYFRIFNPVTQSEKFDAEGKFIRRYLPQLGQLDHKVIHAPWLAQPITLKAAGVALGENYPFPVVDHAEARTTTLQRYSVVRKTS